MAIIFPPLLQTVSITPGNTTSNAESNIIWNLMITTAAHMATRIRMGTTTFPLPDAQFAEPTAMDT